MVRSRPDEGSRRATDRPAGSGLLRRAWVPLLLTSLAALVRPSPAVAQSYTIQPVQEITSTDPRSGFSLGIRLLGKTEVTFRNVGSIRSLFDYTDMQSETARFYDDGVVNLDARTASDGTDLPDDWKTYSWSFLNEDQVLADQSGIAFHNFSSESNGSTIDADSSAEPGIDMEFSQRFGSFGAKRADKSSAWVWGGMIGGSFSTINAKTRGTVTADLHTVTDYYFLDGQVPPEAPYSAPSSKSITTTDSDGNTVPVTVDTSVYLGNRPYGRSWSTAPDAAEIEGFWQVRGAYFTVRAGPWVRWNFSQRFSLRASAGATYSFLGLDSRYDEWMPNLAAKYLIRASDQRKGDTFSTFGVYAALEGEVWLSRNTGFYASLTYDKTSTDASIEVGDRIADVKLDGGVGVRFGITTRF